MPSCAFLSMSITGDWFVDDDLVYEPLQKLGWIIQNVPWNESVDWNIFDLVVIRSPWDYQDHFEEFTDVLKKIDESKAILINNLKTVMWNIDKNYLFELENKGVEIVPTTKAFSLNKSDIKNAFEKFKTNELIIKPVIGANADDTFRVNKKDNSELNEIELLFRDRECMIQPFMQNITKEGEYSLMYFQGKLSHTILKTVAAGDYRVQEEHGGGVVTVNKPEALIVESGKKAMNALYETPLYARVDLVRTTQNTFALMELELIEPSLYFRFNDDSAYKFASCIDEFWKNQKLLNNKV